MDKESEYIALRQGIVYQDLATTSLIELRGKDAITYLNSQCTQNVETLENFHGKPSALLNRDGKLRSLFSCYKMNQSCWLVCHEETTKTTIEAIEKFHITEEFEIIDYSEHFSFIAIQGPLSYGLIQQMSKTPLLFSDRFRLIQTKLFEQEVAIFTESLFSENGVLIALPSNIKATFIEKTEKLGEEIGIQNLSTDVAKIARLEVGNLHFGSELSPNHLLPGTGLETNVINYDKGCFIGQEVVARIKTYQKNPQFIFAAKCQDKREDLSSTTLPQSGDLLKDNKKIGEVLAHYIHPLDKSWIFIMLLKKKISSEEKRVELLYDDSNLNLELLWMPILNSSELNEKSKELYHESLNLFSETPSNQMDTPTEGDHNAIQLLKKAIQLNPSFSDAYEVLGVLLGRQKRYDEAIQYLRHLQLIDPQCMMAYTNLSILYMQKGDIQTAEDYKAKATALNFQQAAAQAKQKRSVAQQKQMQLDELKRKKKMFQEVLELDKEDVPALFGYGKSCIELQEYNNAISPLSKVIRLQPDYSVAYLNLGKCYELKDDKKKAYDCYQEGILIAKKKGDLMPLKEMESRIAALSLGTN